MKGKVTPPTEESVSYKVTCENKNVETTNTNEVTILKCGDENVGTCDICEGEGGHDLSMVCPSICRYDDFRANRSTVTRQSVP